MKRFGVSALLLAMAAASSAQAQVYDGRGYGYDDGYDNGQYQDDQYDQYDQYAGRQYPGDQYQDAGVHDGGQYDVARVLSVEPMVERGAQPVRRQECWNEQAPGYAHGYGDRYPQPRTTGGGAVIGAIVGGALGNTVGHGDDRQVATVLGAVLGGAIGNGIERSNVRRQDAYYGNGNGAYNDQYAARGVQRCRVVADQHVEEHVVGYRVNYEYAGRQYQTVTDYHPGSEMRVRVEVVPEG
jgi:uncharacterized protein YcfJ